MRRTLHRIDVEMHQAVFTWVRRRLADTGSARGNAIGIGAAMPEANPASRSVLRRDAGEGDEP